MRQQQAGQHRHQRQRQDHRAGQGEDDRQRHRPEQLALDPFQGQDRQVDDHDDQFAEQGRLADLDGGVADHVELGLLRQVAVGEVADAVLDHDHRAVHDQAEVDGPQAQQAGGDAEAQHAGEGEEHRQRDGQRHDGRRPQVAQEEEQHGDDQQAALEQVAAHGVDDVVDQLGAVVDRLDLARRRAAPP